MPLKILLADDSLTAQNMGKKILADAGHVVTAVSNGAAAAKKLGDKIDLFIFDVYMPGFTGIELCEKVRANIETNKTPVLLTVGQMESYNAQDGQRVKADGVIIKPFVATDLLALVQKIEKKIIAAATPPPPPLIPKNATGEYERTMIFTPPQIEEFKDDSYHEWKTEAEDTTSAEHRTPTGNVPVPAFEETIRIAGPKKTIPPTAIPDLAETIKVMPPAPVAQDTIPMAPPPSPPAFASLDDTISFTPPGIDPAAAATAMAAFEDTVTMMTPVVPTAPPPAPAATMAEFEDTIKLKRTAEQMNEFLDTVQMPVPDSNEMKPTVSVDMLNLSAASMPAFAGSASAMDFPAASPPAMEFAPSAPAMEMSMPPAVSPMAELETTTVLPASSIPATATDVEFTAAPKAGAVVVKPESGLETDEPTTVLPEPVRDPSLVTDPTEMASAFVTKFGVEGAEADDDFEGKVRIPGITPVAPPAPVDTVAAKETRSAAAQPSGTVDFDAQLASKLHEYEQPASPTATVEATPAEPLIPEPATADKGMTADLMAQMHDAVADMEVATAPHDDHLVDTVTMPTPADEAPVPIPGGVAEVSLDAGGVDHELASQLAAAVGAEPPAPEIPAGVPAGSLLSGVPIESSTISSVVSRVLERMMPVIVGEVLKELDSMKK